MLEYVLWFISFISLFVSLVWFSTFYLSRAGIVSGTKTGYFPTVTITIPAYNEEATILKTLKSLLRLDYPKGKLQIIVVDDGSTDRTYDVVKNFLQKNKSRAKAVMLVTQKNGGKAAALNTGIKNATGELFGCVDADSTVSVDSLKKIVQHFTEENVGAVVSTIRVRQEKTFLQKLQRFEYIFTSFFRKLLTSMDVLYVTPGVLSVYNKSVLLKLGGFDEQNITEDLEIGLRLQYHRYKVLLEIGSKTYTDVPATLREFWIQRIRWLRGHIHNSIKYKDMLFNSEYGFMGMFQFPLNVFSPVLLLMSASIITYGFIQNTYWSLVKASVAPYSLFEISMPTIKEFVLSLKIPVLFPLAIIIILGVFLYQQAHKYLKETWQFPFVFIIFLLIYPAMVSYIWVVAIIQEFTRAKKKWS